MENQIQLDRALYKKIKSFNKTEMQQFITNIYETAAEKYQENVVTLDTERLRNELSQIKGIGENRLNEIMNVIEKYLTSEE